MKTEDFERLKTKLGDEFIAEYRVEKDLVMVLVKKKDLWEGVEYASILNNTIVKVLNYSYQSNTLNYRDIEGLNYPHQLDHATPSTESAYIEQLKKECFEKFGEIKEGEKFKRDFDISIDEICTIGECKNTLEFKYFKSNDSLEFCGSIIYQSGRWATRVNERVKVNPVGLNQERCGRGVLVNFAFEVNSLDFTLNGASTFLASQLEKYLNGEV